MNFVSPALTQPRLCTKYPVVSLAAAHRFGTEVQIWHDYVSIPQWQEKFRGTVILPQIFQIFKHGKYSLIHLDVEPTIHVLETYSPENYESQTAPLQHLFSCPWFQRMWPVIEHDVWNDAYFVNGNYEIMPTTLFSFMAQIVDCNLGSSGATAIHAFLPLASALLWVDSTPMFVRERVKNRCLGYLYDMTGKQGCRSYRDRFIALCALLEEDLDSFRQTLTGLPQDPQEACMWLAKRCLSSNDYSPLLLLPSGEAKYEKA